MTPFDPTLADRMRQQQAAQQQPLPVAQGAPASATEQPASPLPRAQVPRGTPPQQSAPLAFPQYGKPNETQTQQTLRQTEQQGSRISRIHNPFLRTAAGIGDAILGTFAPRAEQLIPGTEGNYALHLARAQNAVKGEREVANEESEDVLRRAQAHHATAEAEQLENPQAKPAANPVELFQKDPDAFAKYEEAVQKAAKDHEPQMIKDGEGNIVGMIDAQLKFHSRDDPNVDPQAKAIMEAAKPKPQVPKTASELWISQHPNGTAEDLQAFLSKQPKESQLSADDEAILKSVGGDPRVDIRDQPIQVVNKFLAKKKEHIQNPPQPPVVLVPNENGMMVPTQAKLGVPLPANFGTVSGTAAANVKAAEGQANAKAALDYGVNYLKSGQFTGPGDEALMEKYFELAKPSSGFRMSQPQIDMLLHARSWMGSAEGIAYHAKTGEWFPPQQRKEIVDTMANLGAAKGIKSEGGGAPATIPYKIGNKPYNIPADQEKEFLKDHPEAKKSGR